MKITITESRLKHLIKNTIREFLNKTKLKQEKKIIPFDLSDVTKEDIEQIYFDYELIHVFPNFSNPINQFPSNCNNIEEAKKHFCNLSNITEKQAKKQFINYKINCFLATKNSLLYENKENVDEPTFSQPLDTVKKEIIDKYHLDDWQFQIEKRKNNVEIALVIPSIEDNYKFIINDMKKMGYFLSKYDTVELYNKPYLLIQFEPYFQESVNNTIKANGMLFHITPLYNLDNIIKNGLKPSSNNNEFNYPNRIYFLMGNVSNQYLIKYTKGLYSTNKDKRNNGQYVILTFDSAKIADGIEFFADPNTDDYGVYTNKSIPPQYIENIIKIDLITNKIIK